jgi:hypothetical protein
MTAAFMLVVQLWLAELDPSEVADEAESPWGAVTVTTTFADATPS